jgi:hypothetical protein
MEDIVAVTDIVQSYFRSIGVGKPKSPVVFAKNGAKRFETPFKELLSIIDDRTPAARRSQQNKRPSGNLSRSDIGERDADED